MQIHGIEDALPVVPFDGSDSFPSIPAIIEFWYPIENRWAECVVAAEETAIADITGDGYGGRRTRYLDCAQGTEVAQPEHRRVRGGSVRETLPATIGPSTSKVHLNVGRTSSGTRAHIHAAEEIWTFTGRYLVGFSLYGGD